MTEHANLETTLRFGTFEFDPRAGELRKNGRKVRLQEQPLRLLEVLVERPGDVVSRDELRERLWPADTFVDFDNSLNTAASKLRDALGDSASSPRFIETLPRRGYRFLASVEVVGPATADTNGRSNHEDVAETAPERFDFRRLAWPALSGLLLAVVLMQWLGSAPQSTDAPVRRFAVRPTAAFDWPVISPDGRHVAYVAAEALWVQDLDQDEPRRIVQGEVRREPPVWSPDSQEIAYSTGRELRKVATSGGPSSLIYDFGKEFFFSGAAWSPDGQWTFFAGEYWQDSRLLPGAIYRVSVNGGKPELLPGGGRDGSQPIYAGLQFLPTGSEEWALLASRAGQIVVRTADTDEESVLAEGVQPFYSPTGHVLYTASNNLSLWAIPFSAQARKATGEPFPVRESSCFASVSNDGTLVYIDNGKTLGWQLGWRDWRGNRLGFVGQPQRSIRYPEISPDGLGTAVAGVDNGDEHIWIHDAERSVKMRSTLGTGRFNRGPLWLSPREIVFSSQREGSFDLYEHKVGGAAAEEKIHATEKNEFASDVSPDGRTILFDSYGEGEPADIWYLGRRPNGESEPKPFLTAEFEEKAAKFSPDGRWVAYVSDESGKYEVYVCRFPEGDRKRKVSEEGGTGPRWSTDGRKLYYVQETLLIETNLRAGEEIEVGTATPLFRAPELSAATSAYPMYDVSDDGERFLLRERAADFAIRVVENWFSPFARVQ